MMAFATCETADEAMQLARSVRPTLEDRIEDLEETVDALRSIAAEGLMEALTGLPDLRAGEDEQVWTTPFGYAVRREGRWVAVLGPNGKECRSL